MLRDEINEEFPRCVHANGGVALVEIKVQTRLLLHWERLEDCLTGVAVDPRSLHRVANAAAPLGRQQSRRHAQT